MPPKPKLHKSTGKKGIAPPVPSTSSAPARLEPELEQQFEVELCWCIQQLQRSISSGKLKDKQLQETTKTLNTLMGNSAPLIKKRQLMRLTFGDYRSKMQEEDKKQAKLVANIKIEPAEPSKRSVFVKKSAFKSSDNSFRFNFDLDEAERLGNEIKKVKIENDGEKKEKFSYNATDNSFKFNFTIDE